MSDFSKILINFTSLSFPENKPKLCHSLRCIKIHVDLKREYKIVIGVVGKEKNKWKLSEGTYVQNVQVHSLQHPI